MHKNSMRRKVTAIALASAFALSGVVSGTAFAGNPHAGNSGHFKGSANPCPQNEQQCPPQND
jgi:hypothetical protein